LARPPASLLFCCTANALRSPMAEALAKFLFGRAVHVDSVGLRAGEVDGFAVAVMDELGIDISRHRPKTFAELDDRPFELIISLSPEAQHHALELTRGTATRVELWNTFDPSLVEGNRETRLEAYRAVRDQLLERLKQRFELPGAPV
jgi:protein-tyrosine-phosphatase